MIRFDGRTVLIGGAGGGIGAATARLFSDLGAAVVLGDLGTRACPLAEELRQDRRPVEAVALDVTDMASCEAAAGLAARRFGGIDAAVAAAGVFRRSPAATMGEAEWRDSLAVNLDGVFAFCRTAIPHMRRGGAIVAVASIAAHRGSFRHAHYAAAKGGVLAYVRSLAAELGPDLRVNAVSPGLIDTPMVQGLMDERGRRMVEATPAGRLGRPEEVASVIAFLASDAAAYVTGETVHVNGGLYMG